MNGFERVHECIGYWTDAGQWQVLPDKPIVRCKDCAYHDEHGYMPGRVTCRMHSGIWGKDDFCSKAEKKED